MNYRDQNDHPAFPIDDPYDKVALRGMSVNCWVAAQIASGILSGGDRAGRISDTEGMAKWVAEFSVACADEIIEALHKSQEKRRENQAQAPQGPQLTLMPPPQPAADVPPPATAPVPSEDVQQVPDSPGAEDT